MAEEPAHLFVGLTEDQTRALEIALEEIGYYMVADSLRENQRGAGKEDIAGMLCCVLRTDRCWRELDRPAFHTHILGALFDGAYAATMKWDGGAIDPAKL